MRVTIIADASWCPDSGASGYAFRIASNRGNKSGKDHPPNRLNSSNEAEMLALVAAVIHACILGLLHPGDELIMQTDCQSAIDAFLYKRMKTTKEEKDLVKEMTDLVVGLNLIVEYRHVKGHTNLQDKRSRANRFCDEKARIEMRKSRSSLTMADVIEAPSPVINGRIHLPWDSHDEFCGLSPEDVLGYFPGDRE